VVSVCLLKNGLKQNSSCFYCKSLDFLDHWIKLLLTWSLLCNDCLDTMSYLYIPISIYIYTLSQHNPLKLSFFENFPSLLLPPGQRVLARQSLAGLGNVGSAQTMSAQAQVRGCLNPRTIASSPSLSFSTVTSASSSQSYSLVTKVLKGE
jgi:hypothetical protein